jgi:vancomycin permeability regulator SanA
MPYRWAANFPWRKIFIACFAALLAAAAFVFWANQRILDVGLPHIRIADDVPKSAAIMILGAYVSPAGEVSEVLEERLKVGYELYRRGKAGKIIVSGDHGRTNYDEVNAMKKYLIARNVPVADVFMDHAGFTTYESMYRARAVFKADSLIIVTQRFHLPRAVFLARELGIDACGVASDTGDYVDRYIVYNNIRETFARSKALLSALLKPRPTFLGDAIPVTGDGRATDDKVK